MSNLNKQIEVCRRCGHLGTPIQKLGYYLCEKCRVIMGYGVFSTKPKTKSELKPRGAR